MYKTDLKRNWPWAEYERAIKQIATKVIPRLLGENHLTEHDGSPIKHEYDEELDPVKMGRSIMAHQEERCWGCSDLGLSKKLAIHEETVVSHEEALVNQRSIVK